MVTKYLRHMASFTHKPRKGDSSYKILLGRPKEDNIKMNLWERAVRGEGGCNWLRIMSIGGLRC